MSNFFLTLPSNASAEVFPGNTLTNYTVKLPHPINFGDYTVALVGIQYPNAWENITWECALKVYLPEDRGTKLVTLPPGKYDDISQVIKMLHKKLKKIGIDKEVYLTYNNATKKTHIHLTAQGYRAQLSPKLSNILGFSRNNNFIIEPDTEGLDVSDVDEGMTSLFVYSPILQNQMVGDVMSPLLRVVPLKSNHNDKNIYHEFTHLRYIPLIDETSDLINIDIRRDNGQSIPFISGKVIVTLHFKKIK